MRNVVLCVVLCVAMALAAGCGGKTASSKQPPGDPNGGGDPAATAVTPPPHVKVTSGSGEASSPNFKARVRVGGPVPAGVATGSEKKLTGSAQQSP